MYKDISPLTKKSGLFCELLQKTEHVIMKSYNVSTNSLTKPISCDLLYPNHWFPKGFFSHQKILIFFTVLSNGVEKSAELFSSLESLALLCYNEFR
ncbi:MAG: hypothetical protein U0M15_04670 [Bacillota bacterium]|nr:hypothetical protein [Bacillota bacterium]